MTLRGSSGYLFDGELEVPNLHYLMYRRAVATSRS